MIAHRLVRRLYTVRPLAVVTVLLWIVAVWGAWNGFEDIAIGLAMGGIIVTVVAVRRGRSLADLQRDALESALVSADARNRELERLRHLAQTLLSGRSLSELQQEVALAAAELLQAESGGITILVEEGRFLRVVAATGPLAPTQGMLLPVASSLLGWVATHDEPLTVDKVDHDPRAYRNAPVPVRLRSME